MTLYRLCRLLYLRLIGVGRRVARQEKAVEQDINYSVFAKGRERFVIVHSEYRRHEALRAVGQWARNKDLDSDWLDAMRVSQLLRQQAMEAEVGCAGVNVRIAE